jgi:hypothetical protein
MAGGQKIAVRVIIALAAVAMGACARSGAKTPVAAQSPGEPQEVDAPWLELPIVDLGGAPIRVWAEFLDGGDTIGRIRITGQVDDTGSCDGGYDSAYKTLRAFLDGKNVDGYLTAGVGDFFPANGSVPSALAYRRRAHEVVAEFLNVETACPALVEVKALPLLEADPGVEKPPNNDEAVRIRAPNAGPAFIPMQVIADGGLPEPLVIHFRPGEISLPGSGGETAVSAYEPTGKDSPWPALSKRFEEKSGSKLDGTRTFFVVRKAGDGAYDARCVYVVAGSYVEVWDSKNGVVRIEAPTTSSAGDVAPERGTNP